MQKAIKIIVQIGILYLFYYIGSWVQTTFHLLMPGSIIGMLLLFGLLMMNTCKPTWVDKGASFLLSHLPLLFIPVTVGIIDFLDLFKGQGIFAVLVVVISSVLVMVASALASQFIAVRKNKQLSIEARKQEGI